MPVTAADAQAANPVGIADKHIERDDSLGVIVTVRVLYRAAIQFQSIADDHKEALYEAVQRLSQNAVSANLQTDRAV